MPITIHDSAKKRTAKIQKRNIMELIVGANENGMELPDVGFVRRLTTGQIADCLGMSHADTYNRLDYLRSYGLVQNRRDKHDLRGVGWWPTPQGIVAVEVLRP